MQRTMLLRLPGGAHRSTLPPVWMTHLPSFMHRTAFTPAMPLLHRLLSVLPALAAGLTLVACGDPEKRTMAGSAEGICRFGAERAAASKASRPALRAPAGVASAAAKPAPEAEVARRLGEEIASELAQRCPMADPADQRAFTSCRTALHTAPRLRSRLARFTLWGRDPETVGNRPSETRLTQSAADVLLGSYLPLFMYAGTSTVSYSEPEGLYRIALDARFRNRLPPGQSTYPFWHEGEEWRSYERAGSVVLWFDPKRTEITIAHLATGAPPETASPAGPGGSTSQPRPAQPDRDDPSE